MPRSTRLVAWGGFILGLTASVLANVLDTWLPTSHQPPGWEPGLAPQIGAAVWPAALMFALEALSRVPWPGGFWWLVARYGGMGIVALGSAAISYSHVHDVLMSWGYGAGSARHRPTGHRRPHDHLWLRPTRHQPHQHHQHRSPTTMINRQPPPGALDRRPALWPSIKISPPELATGTSPGS